MDILKPQLQYIDGICYRINPGNQCPDFDQGIPQPYYEFDSECSGLIEPEIEEDYEVEKEQSGRYITRFHVAKLFFSYIIGGKGATKKRLEGETKTTISIPKLGCVGDIVITGADKKNVCSARNRVNMLVMSARKKQRPTHFLSIPLNHSVFVQRFTQFKNEVLSKYPHLKKELFQIPDCLHLTIGVLKLCDNIERDQAADALDYCHKNIISNIIGNRRELRVRMQGLDWMNDDPTAVKVLYANVTSLGDSSLLQNLMNEISEYFIKQGLMENNKPENMVFIHATLMNAKFLKKESCSEQDLPEEPFNAAPVLEAYKDFNFGEACISQVDLSVMHTSSSGYWQATASIDLFKF